MSKNDYIIGFCKWVYWKSLTQNPMAVEDYIVPYNLAAPTKKRYLLDLDKIYI